MKLRNKGFWSADTFKDAFRKVSQYRIQEVEEYIRGAHIAYEELFSEIRSRQPNAVKVLDYGAGFGIGWFMGTARGFKIHCADIGNLLDFCPATHKYHLPDDLPKIKKIKWDAVYLKNVLSYIPNENIREFLDSLLELKTDGIYLVNWAEGDPKYIRSRKKIKGLVYQQKRVLPILEELGFEIMNRRQPVAALIRKTGRLELD